MAKQRQNKLFSDNQVLDDTRSAIKIVSEASGLDTQKSREVIRALIDAGYFVAPRVPTNAMLLAYIESYGQLPKNPKTIITAVGKAKRRWQAMGSMGTAMAMSLKRCLNDEKAETIGQIIKKSENYHHDED